MSSSNTSYFRAKLADCGLNNEQINKVMAAIDTTCHYCWQAEDTCQCWNDE